MTPDEFTDYQNSQELHCDGWRCVNCGEVVDPVLLQNRMSEHPPIQRTKRRWTMASVG